MRKKEYYRTLLSKNGGKSRRIRLRSGNRPGFEQVFLDAEYRFPFLLSKSTWAETTRFQRESHDTRSSQVFCHSHEIRFWTGMIIVKVRAACLPCICMALTTSWTGDFGNSGKLPIPTTTWISIRIPVRKCVANLFCWSARIAASPLWYRSTNGRPSRLRFVQ